MTRRQNTQKLVLFARVIIKVLLGINTSIIRVDGWDDVRSYQQWILHVSHTQILLPALHFNNVKKPSKEQFYHRIICANSTCETGKPDREIFRWSTLNVAMRSIEIWSHWSYLCFLYRNVVVIYSSGKFVPNWAYSLIKKSAKCAANRLASKPCLSLNLVNRLRGSM